MENVYIAFVDGEMLQGVFLSAYKARFYCKRNYPGRRVVVAEYQAARIIRGKSSRELDY